MLQYECVVCGSVKIRNDLDEIVQAVISKLLQLGGGERVWLDQGGSAAVLEVALQPDGEAVDFEKRSLADGPFQFAQPLEMVRVVPKDRSQLKVGPIYDFAGGQKEFRPFLTNELHKCSQAIEKALRRIGPNLDAFRLDEHPVGLLSQRRTVRVHRVADGHPMRGHLKSNYTTPPFSA